MKLVPLSEVSAQLREGVALAWNVRDEMGQLLLARGHLVDSSDLSDRLRERGMYVDMDEVRAHNAEAPAQREQLFDRLRSMESTLATLLRNPYSGAFSNRISEMALDVRDMSQHHSDPMIFDVMQPRMSELINYGTNHSLQTAAVCALISSKMNWPSEEINSLIEAALTMNIAMIDLQGHFANRRSRPTPEQQEAIFSHPGDSCAILRKAGVTNALWLRLVEEHHETPGGAGYPRGTQTPHEMAQMLHLVDVFLAKHSPRAHRAATPPKQAAQEIYKQTNGHPVAALLIKEFGMYPPGCHVQLASEEVAIVTHRGSHANTPRVAVLVNRKGEQMGTPVVRDTADSAFKIVNTLPPGSNKVNFIAASLYDKTNLE